MRVEPIIQVAGVRDRNEALMLCESGVTHLGFPLRLDHHREDLSDSEARNVIRHLPPEVGKVLITYLTDTREILDLADYLGTPIIQLHGPVSSLETARLRQGAQHSHIPDLTVIRSLIVGRLPNDELVRLARSFSEVADFFLTDTFDVATGASGATGKTHNWQMSRRLVLEAGRPVILAGGLRPENVRDAILTVRPAGVDSHTGVEGPDGRKDRSKVECFVRAARRAFGELSGER